MQLVVQSVSWMSLEENVDWVAGILRQVKRVDASLGQKVQWDSLLKAGNKVQGQISCLLVASCLRTELDSVATKVVDYLVTAYVDTQLKNVNKLVTNYPLLLGGLAVLLAGKTVD